ncbi:MAG TPA: LptA/OstA family protein [Caulobacteraceae bacterium]|jgi:lipopolysaccharide export system protein LptA|nr:LptA/OstA family protein [Caulobacteraceae bacterium]
MTRYAQLGFAGAMAGLALAATAGAQVDTKSNAPIDITANQAEVINSKCLAIWRGAAEALQGDSRLRADTISVYAAPKGVGADGQQSCGGTQKVVADGHVYYVTPTQNARGDHAVYLANADEIVLTGDVIVVQGKDVARGDKLTIKTNTKQFIMESRSGGEGRAGRVRGVVYPDKQNQPGAGPKS